ncbi:Protein fam72a [Phlyctochytrium planicorne]|nr:Protein fam72a [Phlyctochytrium planicorne]
MRGTGSERTGSAPAEYAGVGTNTSQIPEPEQNSLAQAESNLRRRMAISRAAAQISMREVMNNSRIPQARNYALPQYEYTWNQWRGNGSLTDYTQLAQAPPPAPASSSTSSVHPSFRSKSVCKLQCKFCVQQICKRGMKAILLADTRVELYSTDTVPAGIRDVACLGCGNLIFDLKKVIGYHVTQPCDVCMSACNNGHFWMFHDDSVTASERMDGAKALLWSQLPYVDKEKDKSAYFEKICR